MITLRNKNTVLVKVFKNNQTKIGQECCCCVLMCQTLAEVMLEMASELLSGEPQPIDEATPFFSHVGSCYSIRLQDHLWLLIGVRTDFELCSAE